MSRDQFIVVFVSATAAFIQTFLSAFHIMSSAKHHRDQSNDNDEVHFFIATNIKCESLTLDLVAERSTEKIQESTLHRSRVAIARVKTSNQC